MTVPPGRDDELDLTIIIVSYETRDMTIECIRSVLQQTSAVRYEIIVVDNASTDGSAEAIRQSFPAIHLIASAENIGFGRGNNLAALHARGRRLLLLNPDTLILDHAIDHLHAFAVSNPECRIWGGRTVSADGTLDPTSCWGRATAWSTFCYAIGLTGLKASIFNPEGYGRWKRDTVRAVDIVTGCFLMIDRDLWESAHGFDPTFFMYGEEADLCLRAQKLGARPAFTPTATIIHYGGASETDRAEQRIKVLAGRMTLMRRHQSARVVFVGRLLYLVLPVSRLTVFGLAGALLGRADFQHKAQVWRNVWRNRKRWINGWSDAAVTSARAAPRPVLTMPPPARANGTWPAHRKSPDI